MTSDSSYYEKFADGTEKCIDDELQFEIPESWMWCRLGSVITLLSGQDQPPSGYNSSKKGIPYITGASNIENNNIVINRWTETPKAIADNGDLLVTCKGTVGTMAIVNCGSIHIARQIMAIKNIYQLDIEYIMLFISANVESLKNKAKSMIPGIARNDMLNLLFPLPPINEQKIIIQMFESIINRM